MAAQRGKKMRVYPGDFGAWEMTSLTESRLSLGKGFTNLKLVDLVSVVVIQGKLVIRLNNLLFECWQPRQKN